MMIRFLLNRTDWGRARRTLGRGEQAGPQRERADGGGGKGETRGGRQEVPPI